MNKVAQRDLFLVLTVVGIFASFVAVVGGTVLTIGAGQAVWGEMRARDTTALMERMRMLWPTSLVASAVLLGTFFSYRRYERLIALENAAMKATEFL